MAIDERERVERLVSDVLLDLRFAAAAKAYAAELHDAERQGDIANIFGLVRKRERFINAYAQLARR